MPSVKKVSKVSKAVRKTVSVDVYTVDGKVAGKMDLQSSIFDAPINENIMAQAVRVQLANKRGGTVSTKNRGEVRGSTRKIYKQKGTGRARHGGIRAPIFVKGGIAFGPRPRDYSLSFPKKMKKNALFSALSSKLKENEIKLVKGLETIDFKTKAVISVLKNLKVDKKRGGILLVLPNNNTDLWKASRNIEGMHTKVAKQLNTVDVLSSKTLIIMDLAVETLEKHFLK